MKGIKRILLAMFAVVVLAIGGLAGMNSVAYADGEAEVTLIVYQTFSADAAVDDSFEYCLEAQTANAPMPDEAQGKSKYCFTMKGDETYSMVMRADASTPKVSEYDLRLVTSLPEGYSLSSSSSYHYKLYAHHSDKLILIAYESSGTKTEDPGFSLTYESGANSTDMPSPPPSTIPPSSTPNTPSKPPVSALVRTGATVSLGAMIALLVVGGLLLSRRREAE